MAETTTQGSRSGADWGALRESSLRKLSAIGLPVSAEIPLANIVPVLRPKEEVAKRTICLFECVFVTHHTATTTAEWFRQHGLWESLTPKEKAYLLAAGSRSGLWPQVRNLIHVGADVGFRDWLWHQWRQSLHCLSPTLFECDEGSSAMIRQAGSPWVWLWFGRLVDGLDLTHVRFLYDEHPSYDYLPSTARGEPPDRFVRHMKSRRMAEVLPKYDFAYCLDWLLQARKSRTLPHKARFDRKVLRIYDDVVTSHRRALEWLITPTPWDDIPHRLPISMSKTAMKS